MLQSPFSCSVPVQLGETSSATGMAAFCRRPDAKHPGKTRNNAGGESLLSLPAFLLWPYQSFFRS